MAVCFVSAHSIMDTYIFRATQFMGRETVMGAAGRNLVREGA